MFPGKAYHSSMPNPKIILTNLCMLYRLDGSFLVQLRKKQDWPGINFPGGHVEFSESISESVIREMKEETGLTVKDLIPCGYFEWNIPSEGVRHLSLLFKSCHFEGKMRPNEEGELFWLKEEEIDKFPQATDFRLLLEQMKRY